MRPHWKMHYPMMQEMKQSPTKQAKDFLTRELYLLNQHHPQYLQSFQRIFDQCPWQQMVHKTKDLNKCYWL